MDSALELNPVVDVVMAVEPEAQLLAKAGKLGCNPAKLPVLS